MRKIIIPFLALFLFSMPVWAAEGLGSSIEQFGDSILGGLDNLGQTLNQANSSLLGENPANNPASYEEQMRAYRQAEAARVRELSIATGVNPSVIQDMRANGMTWNQIASKYDVDLQSLPAIPFTAPYE